MSFTNNTSFVCKFKCQREAEDYMYQNDPMQTVYIDGACTNNGQEGAKCGYGVFWGDCDSRNVSASLEGKQTNQRAELKAAQVALEQALQSHVDILEVRTDSEYVIKCVTIWADKWEKNGWKNANGKDVQNQDLIISILCLSEAFDITWVHVKAHNGDYGNKEADQLAREGITKPPYY